MNYNFSTLNDRDLEELARELLTAELKVELRSFKPGKDKGIDARYSTNSDDNEIVVQVKHYLESGVSKLMNTLQRDELPKARLLNPKRYIIVTSLPLTVKEIEQVRDLFSPYILSLNDVIDKERLNQMLGRHPKIEEAHFKLWLSSTNVFQRLLNNAVKGRSEFNKNNILHKIKLFVPNKSYRKAVEILNERNFILIIGAPGIGKTTLANMLTYQLLANDFELVYINETREGEEVYEEGKKQVFYFDDFLGSATLDLQSSRNADSAIVNFVERVKSDPHKKLILTCRTSILNQAKEVSDKISQSKVELARHEVRIEDYSNLDKANILYNHVYVSPLTEEQKEVFFRDQFYWDIIRHRNYNPRVIEFFTDPEHIDVAVAYKQQVLDMLDNPQKIWQKSIDNQLSWQGRLLLMTIFSLGGRYEVSEGRLKKAFEARIDYETRESNFKRSGNVFNSSLREITGAYIIRTKQVKAEGENIYYRLINASLEDYFNFYFHDNREEYYPLLRAAAYFEQFDARISTKYTKYPKKIFFGDRQYKELLMIFSSKKENLDGFWGGNPPGKSLVHDTFIFLGGLPAGCD